MTPALSDIGKRILIGRKLRSTQLGETLLPKKIALPVFASDALSSVAYAPDEIFLTLSLAGLAAYSYSWKIGLLVAFVMLVVVASYRQNVHAYPSGGGDYEVATVNIGPNAGLTVASALMVDYVLTVAVSISSGVQNAKSALPFLAGHEVPLAVALVVILTALNLRGVRESGALFAVPTYIFMASIIGMAIWGIIRLTAGNLPLADSAQYEIRPEPGHEVFSGLAAAFLLARAFSSGCAALTGVEAISNGVPAFRKPKSKNAATTLLLLGTIAITMLMSIIFLADKIKLRYAEDPATQLLLNGEPVGDSYTQKTVIGQIGDSVFSNFPAGFYLVIGATMLILVLAANTAFNGFPVLASILAKDGYLPRQLHTRGDRLAYSNGIILLALCAIGLIIAFDAEVTKLIQLYIVGVFVSFTLSQFGMIRHWTRYLKTETDSAKRRKMMRSRSINAVGLTLTGIVLVIVLVTKFTHGAYIAIIAMAVLFVLMKGIRKHYDTVGREMAVDAGDKLMLPARVHAIVLVSKLHKPTLRALAFAKAARPYILEAVTVDVDRDESDLLQAEWDRRDIPVPLKRLASPYREITRPILQYVRDIRRQSPRDVVMVYIPEYVVGHWWEHILHNQSALRLKGRLLFTPGVMVTSVPYQLISSQAAEERQDREERVAGQVRRGARKSSGDR
ncbi:amino acid transporter [Kribbella orskensis]|uniref:Amino acid transporter n=1 Tax=Kribbella orskensis TaxID=2512216 RepID=A0ABY2B8A0_9ACTN|nr:MULTISPECIES: APC family permease [Kribbella]TCN31054.1 amino acid transporter [Kribbella sp. VKM Ac-2500]TCO11589.1 amino acid transporter [Kribbella orskensis]